MQIHHVFTISVVLLFSGSCLSSIFAQPEKNFILTRKSYSENANHQQIVKEWYGPRAKVADWSNIKSNLYASEVNEWADEAGLGNGKSAWIEWGSKEAQKTADGELHHYHISRKGENIASYLAVDDIGELIFLGRWEEDRKPIMVNIQAVESDRRPERSESTSGSQGKLSDEAERLKVCAQYQTRSGWSDSYGGTANVISGSFLNKKAGAPHFDSSSSYAVIFWGNDQATVLKLRSATGNITAYDTKAVEVDRRGNTGRTWRLSTSSTCN
jgi:hypothetical protein